MTEPQWPHTTTDEAGVEVKVLDKDEVGGEVPQPEETQDEEEVRGSDPHEAATLVGAKVRLLTPVTRHRDMLTSLHSSPVGATGPMGRLHISAWNQPRVLGRSSGSRRPIIEGLTSSKKVTTNSKEFMS